MSTEKKVHPIVQNALWNLCFTLEGRNTKGEMVNKDFFPKNQYKAALSLRKKITTNIKEDNGSTVIVPGDFTLTDEEKKYVADCVKEREDLPALDEAGLEMFTELTGVNLVE